MNRASKNGVWLWRLSWVLAGPGIVSSFSIASLGLEVTAHLERLQSSNLEARVSAACSLIESGAAAKSAFPALVDALTKDEDLDRIIASRVIYARPRPAKDAPVLAKALSYETKARTAAAWEISRMGPSTGTNCIRPLIDALKSEDKHARNFAAVACGMIGPLASEAIPGLTTVLLDTGSDKPQTNYKYPRAAAAFALGMIGPPAKGALPALRQSLEVKAGGPEWEYHLAAVCFALSRIGPNQEDTPKLQELAHADNALVRDWAARALEQLMPEFLGEGATNSSPVSRSQGTTPELISGLRLLGQFAETARPVRKGAGRQAVPVHESITLALGFLDSLPRPPTPEEIQQQGNAMSEEVRRYLLALGGVQQRIVPTLLQSLLEREQKARALADSTAGKPGAAQFAHGVPETDSDFDWVVRYEFFYALRRLSPLPLIPSAQP